MKQRVYFFMILCVLLLVGCSGQANESTDDKETAASNKEVVEGENENKNEDIPTAPKDLEAMIAQAPGKLVEEHIDPELETLQAKDYIQYTKFIEETFNPIVKEELETFFAKNKELTSDEIYDVLVYLLASGQYQQLYEKLTNYDHGYVMPDLPEGEDEIELAKNQKTNVVILMDASGSMKGHVADGVKMDLAKEAITNFTGQLEDDVNVSLLAYGHIGTGNDSDKAKSCQAIETMYPLSAYEGKSFDEAMNSFQASGWTPLAGAIEKANELLASYPSDDYKNIVYIVSDGIETCDGNPVDAAKKLNESNIQAKVNIIGFDVDDEGQKQLKQVAESGGGEYVTVRDKQEFEDVITKKWKPSIFQLIGVQGILLNEVVDQMERLYSITNPLIQVSEREANRITNAAYFLKDQKMISSEAATAVIERAKEMRELRNQHFTEMKEEKEAEAKQAHDEIQTKVQEWKDKWFKVLEEE